MSTHSKSFTISPFHQLFCQILDLVEGKSIIMDLHQFHTNSCILLPDGIHMAHEFNGIGRILRHILDFYPGYGYIESAGYGLFYEALWILLIFSLFMAFTYFFEDAAVRKSGTIKIQMVLALAKLYEIYNKYLEIGKDNRLRCATLSVSELLYYTNYINKIMNIYYSHKTLILNLTRKYYMMNNTKLLMNINNKIINKINKYYSRGLYYILCINIYWMNNIMYANSQLSTRIWKCKDQFYIFYISRINFFYLVFCVDTHTIAAR